MPRSRSRRRSTCARDPRPVPPTVDVEHPVRIRADGAELEADYLPAGMGRGLVVFVPGGGSDRLSPRNRLVAGVLASEGFGTLLVDLLTPGERGVDGTTNGFRIDVPLLARRLMGVTDWVARRPSGECPSIGYFGASTGGAVGVRAAVARPAEVDAVVLRGARSDLVGWDAQRVQCPTLMLVGGSDSEVRALNETTFREMACPKELHVIPGATHLFEEPGALEEVADRALRWFTRYLVPEENAGSNPSSRSRLRAASTTRATHHLPAHVRSPAVASTLNA